MGGDDRGTDRDRHREPLGDHAGRTYDRIASHFSKTREHPWPEVEEFLADRRGRVALDVGCGNGRHAELLADRADRVVGLDASRNILFEAQDRSLEREFADTLALVKGDAARLPFTADAFDLALSVATVHHLRDRDRRVESLDELARVLAPGGRALVSVWSTRHSRFEDVPERGDEGRTEGTDDDVGFDTTVDWTLPGGETVPRFYHIYAPAEFEADLASSRLAVEESFVSSGNCYAVVGPGGFSQQ